MATLEIISDVSQHLFKLPVKQINDGEDVSFFLTSTGYSDIVTFLFQLNAAMFPSKVDGRTKIWELNSSEVESQALSLPVIQSLRRLLDRLEAAIDEAPPDTGPRRFGNISFRKWYQTITSRIGDLLDEHLANDMLPILESSATAKGEVQAYLLGSFGSAQRLDYGTGHELSFLAFLGCIWKLGGFTQGSESGDEGHVERSIVLEVIEPYLRLIRRLILTYTLEPAGSHGVWGLDDHSFVPYIFGSAQLATPITSVKTILPTEGSVDGAPDPADVIKRPVVERERKTNMYFSAIGFIYDVKRGPFFEHSPILYDISGVKAGWAKINKGMLKMYNAEVLSKFPVVQHFPFGSLFRWERNPNAIPAISTIHTASQPTRLSSNPATGQIPLRAPQEGTKAPWASNSTSTGAASTTAAPWASNLPSGTSAGVSEPSTTSAPWASARNAPSSGDGITRAPWAVSGQAQNPPPTMMPPTQAPWTRKGPGQ